MSMVRLESNALKHTQCDSHCKFSGRLFVDVYSMFRTSSIAQANLFEKNIVHKIDTAIQANADDCIISSLTQNQLSLSFATYQRYGFLSH